MSNVLEIKITANLKKFRKNLDAGEEKLHNFVHFNGLSVKEIQKSLDSLDFSQFHSRVEEAKEKLGELASTAQVVSRHVQNQVGNVEIGISHTQKPVGDLSIFKQYGAEGYEKIVDQLAMTEKVGAYYRKMGAASHEAEKGQKELKDRILEVLQAVGKGTKTWKQLSDTLKKEAPHIADNIDFSVIEKNLYKNTEGAQFEKRMAQRMSSQVKKSFEEAIRQMTTSTSLFQTKVTSQMEKATADMIKRDVVILERKKTAETNLEKITIQAEARKQIEREKSAAKTEASAAKLEQIQEQGNIKSQIEAEKAASKLEQIQERSRIKKEQDQEKAKAKTEASAAKLQQIQERSRIKKEQDQERAKAKTEASAKAMQEKVASQAKAHKNRMGELQRKAADQAIESARRAGTTTSEELQEHYSQRVAKLNALIKTEQAKGEKGQRTVERLTNERINTQKKAERESQRIASERVRDQKKVDNAIRKSVGKQESYAKYITRVWKGSIRGQARELRQLRTEWNSWSRAVSFAEQWAYRAARAFSFVKDTGRDFYQTMADARAASGSAAKGGFGDDPKAFRDIVMYTRQLAAVMPQTAKATAEGVEQLAKMGDTAEGIKIKLKPVIQLAKDFGSVGKSAETLNATLLNFGLTTEDVTEVGNIFAVVIDDAAANASTLAQGLKGLKGVTSTTKLEFKEYAASLMIGTDRGLKGNVVMRSVAESLRRLSRNLTPVQSGLKALKIKYDEINPATHNFSEILKVLKDAGADEADNLDKLNTIFGRNAGVIGTLLKHYDQFTNQVDLLADSTGRLQKRFDIQSDTLQGDEWKRNSAAMELNLVMYDKMESGLRDFTQAQTELLLFLARQSDLTSSVADVSNVFTNSIINLTKYLKENSHIVRTTVEQISDMTQAGIKFSGFVAGNSNSIITWTKIIAGSAVTWGVYKASVLAAANAHKIFALTNPISATFVGAATVLAVVTELQAKWLDEQTKTLDYYGASLETKSERLKNNVKVLTDNLLYSHQIAVGLKDVSQLLDSTEKWEDGHLVKIDKVSFAIKTLKNKTIEYAEANNQVFETPYFDLAQKSGLSLHLQYKELERDVRSLREKEEKQLKVEEERAKVIKTIIDQKKAEAEAEAERLAKLKKLQQQISQVRSEWERFAESYKKSKLDEIGKISHEYGVQKQKIDLVYGANTEAARQQIEILNQWRISEEEKINQKMKSEYEKNRQARFQREFDFYEKQYSAYNAFVEKRNELSGRGYLNEINNVTAHYEKQKELFKGNLAFQRQLENQKKMVIGNILRGILDDVATTAEQRKEIEKAMAEYGVQAEVDATERKKQSLFEYLGAAQATAAQIQFGYSTMSGQINSIFSMQMSNIQSENSERLAALDRKEQAELKGVRNARQRQQIEERFKKQREKFEAEGLKKEKKIREKQKYMSMIQAIVNTGEAVTKALPNIPLSILIGILGAAQVSMIASQKFAKGKINIEGPGTSTSDSILARLSKGESVITAQKTKVSKHLLNWIHTAPVEKVQKFNEVSRAMIPQLSQGKINIGRSEAMSMPMPAPIMMPALPQEVIAIRVGEEALLQEMKMMNKNMNRLENELKEVKKEQRKTTEAVKISDENNQIAIKEQPVGTIDGEEMTKSVQKHINERDGKSGDTLQTRDRHGR